MDVKREGRHARRNVTRGRRWMEAEGGSGRVGVGVRRDTGVSMVFKAWGLELGKKIGDKSEGLSSAPADTERPQRRLWSSQCSGKKTWAGGRFKGKGWSASLWL